MTLKILFMMTIINTCIIIYCLLLIVEYIFYHFFIQRLRSKCPKFPTQICSGFFSDSQCQYVVYLVSTFGRHSPTISTALRTCYGILIYTTDKISTGKSTNKKQGLFKQMLGFPHASSSKDYAYVLDCFQLSIWNDVCDGLQGDYGVLSHQNIYHIF